MAACCPGPGEVPLRHKGQLVLDQLSEFLRNVFKLMCQPLKDPTDTLPRASVSHSSCARGLARLPME
jgi:predicted ATPase with chaperone activity